MQFPVLDFGLDHYASQPFMYSILLYYSILLCIVCMIYYSILLCIVCMLYYSILLCIVYCYITVCKISVMFKTIMKVIQYMHKWYISQCSMSQFTN